ncbi:MAG: hypothetical protein EOO75_17710 [Myxococcales bacterium]|nr:MAG: hypothetical protein EOO75_17710 [Myxococcales bacterium]
MSPVSLTDSDGRGLRLVSVDARAAVVGPLSLTELHLRFASPEPRGREGTFTIRLPASAAVSRFALVGEQGTLEGEVVERPPAAGAYEAGFRPRLDPALLEVMPGHEFSARVFPIPASGDPEVIVSYSEERPSAAEPYRLPLAGLPALDALSLRLLADPGDGGPPRVHELRREDITPDHDLVVEPAEIDPGAIEAVRGGRLVVARVTAPAQDTPAAIDRLALLVDTSASRAPGLATQLTTVRALIDRLRRDHGDSVHLTVAAFDQSLAPVFDGPIAGFDSGATRALLARGADGASDLPRALRQASAMPSRPTRLVLVTDGVSTAGSPDDERRALAALREVGVTRLDAVAVGASRDEAALGSAPSWAASPCRGAGPRWSLAG